MRTRTSSLMDGKDYDKNNSQRFDEFMDIVKQLPQQEISDEEIEDASLNIEHYNIDMIVIERIMWRKGAKWYREQLKQK
jgi:hypothetical protein